MAGVMAPSSNIRAISCRKVLCLYYTTQSYKFLVTGNCLFTFRVSNRHLRQDQVFSCCGLLPISWYLQVLEGP
jgi:hypothetical protein